ncbi:hypothetical protein [Arcicella rosea]|uniref:PIN domain-containing protein n=1 Tax=Arcicella rosea TaxID=502909 RepID=A0A841ERL7_9BACT|nr:hypothetical protein [Arcicella rosea]MBB6004029.1 hypothetical protein [Arcicella rosea]
MKKDIFIDNNIASRFKNPADPAYIKLRDWLIKHTEIKEGEIDINAHLVVSQKLLNEYNRSNQNVKEGQNIIAIIGRLQKQGRLVFIKNQAIKDFQQVHFTKKVEKKLTCNQEDREHIPTVLLSHRKYALSIDDNFVSDLINFPGFVVTACKRPEDLPYHE